MTRITPDRYSIIPFLADIFERRGAESYLGEPVTLSEHMLQSALQAEQDGAPHELIAAALLHDVGHYTGAFGTYSPGDTVDRYHEAAGARILEDHFPPVITACVRLHVPAKRYLCATDPTYRKHLSRASVHSLMLQGGPMSDAEVAAFEAESCFMEAVQIRHWDDGGKVAGKKTRSFRDYTELLQSIVDSHAGPSAGQDHPTG